MTWITGQGAVSSTGLGTGALFEAALGGQSAIRGGLGAISPESWVKVDRELGDAASLSAPAKLALFSIRQAMRQAGWSELRHDDGFILGTTAGQIPLWESELIRYSRKELGVPGFVAAILHQSLASVTEVLSRELGFRGRSLVVSSACSASTQALALAELWMREGRVKRCLVGGVEVLSKLTVEGFRSLQLLSPEPAQPFDANRRGINLSEGAAFFCLENRARAPLARISGFGLSTDAYHMASPHPEGRGSFVAMKGALDRAGLEAGDVDWVHAHGTGSRANDLAEGAAIRALFQDAGGSGPWVSSTKRTHGHALGASGALETAICVEALRLGQIPPTAGLRDADPAIPLRHVRVKVDASIRHILKSTLGFGGNNAALVLSAPGKEPLR